ncbi:MFS transporter [Chondrinema litorale]|uniref:MFS transporter n=1 Tax=Chondrinema litorale TaxID=2994555 RepID=UPI002542F90B|nr:MFS transporter [Chondrinema litorale]UZR96066.1 MFS transporter [Chondrinema litorale]
MKNYLPLLKQYPQYLLFGFLHFFFSSMGQTFLVGIYVDDLSGHYQIDTLTFSGIYAASTLIGSFLLPLGGRLIDTFRIRTLSWINGLSIACFGFLLTTGNHIFILFISLIGLRFCGQGFMILLGSTAISRFFTKERGKALSISGLGLTAGEGLLPLFILQITNWQSWQFSWWVLCCAALVVHIPLVKTLIKKTDAFQKAETLASKTEKPTTAKRYDFLKEPSFYVTNMIMMFIPFVITGMFINHNQLVAHKGWTMELLAVGFTLYAVIKVIVSIFFGEAIDRMSAAKLLPFFLIPIGVAFLALAFGNAPWIAMFYLGMTAMSTALFSLLKSAIWAELYPPEYLGSVKGITHFLIIVSSASAPIVFNRLMVNPASAQTAYMVFSSIVVVFSITGYWLASKIERRRYAVAN